MAVAEVMEGNEAAVRAIMAELATPAWPHTRVMRTGWVGKALSSSSRVGKRHSVSLS